jgi:4-hydroxyphenylpyruvate dioxygenase
MTDQSYPNPMGTEGFGFIEFTGPDPEALGALFEHMGFILAARHRRHDIRLYRQNGITFLVNAEKEGCTGEFTSLHGPGVCSFAIMVRDLEHAADRAAEHGVLVVERPGALLDRMPAVKGIGGGLIYLMDRRRAAEFYNEDFFPVAAQGKRYFGHGLTAIDHLTHNVRRGEMDWWADFYTTLFGFREIRHFDIKGKQTGLTSRAMVSPCGRIRIPINESADDKSQIEEFLREFGGPGVQHIALSTDDILASVDGLKDEGIRFMDVPETYYEMVDRRLPGHGQDVDALQARRILIDGGHNRADEDLLLQIFTANLIGPAFFEIIQRKGNQGFGEGNFQALFESIELDQIRRGVLPA